jgi:hypothetical protein
MADTTAMLVSAQLEQVFADAGVDPFTVMEFCHAENSKLLPPMPICSQPLGQATLSPETALEPSAGGT